jgi:hypothetical protein
MFASGILMLVKVKKFVKAGNDLEEKFRQFAEGHRAEDGTWNRRDLSEKDYNELQDLQSTVRAMK